MTRSWEVIGGHGRSVSGPGGFKRGSRQVTRRLLKVARWQGRDSRLESSSDGEIFDEENKEENVKTEEEEKDQAVKNKEENVKTKKGEKDQAVKNFCEIKLKKVTNKLRVQLEKLIKMRAAAEEAQERAEKADSQ